MGRADIARRASIEVWGQVSDSRNFIYVEDCADAIVLAAEKYNDVTMPLNIGTGIGTSIRELVETTNAVTGYRGKIVWNTDKPDGAWSRCSTSREMQQVLGGWVPPTDLQSGLAKTISLYGRTKSRRMPNGDVQPTSLVPIQRPDRLRTGRNSRLIR